MRRFRLPALGLLALALPHGVSAQVPATVTAELAFRTKYLFAGIPFSAEQVTQPKLTVGLGSLTLNGFATFDHGPDELTEADIYGDYYVQAAPTVGVYVGAALYNFKINGSFEPTPEVYGGVALGVPLSPTLHVAHDFDLGDGTRVLLSVSHGVPVGTTGATLDFGAGLDYNDSYWEQYWQVDGSDSGFTFADVSLALSIPIGPLVVSPIVLFQQAIHEDFVDDEVFGVTASMTF